MGSSTRSRASLGSTKLHHDQLRQQVAGLENLVARREQTSELATRILEGDVSCYVLIRSRSLTIRSPGLFSGDPFCAKWRAVARRQGILIHSQIPTPRMGDSATHSKEFISCPKTLRIGPP